MISDVLHVFTRRFLKYPRKRSYNITPTHSGSGILSVRSKMTNREFSAFLNAIRWRAGGARRGLDRRKRVRRVHDKRRPDGRHSRDHVRQGRRAWD